MGYPMTYQRVIHRNELHNGGYDKDPKSIEVGSNPFPGPESFTVDPARYLEILREELERRRGVIERMHGARKLLLGDLRRLETDTVDEQAHCAEIAHRTGVDPEAVQAVLREWLRW